MLLDNGLFEVVFASVVHFSPGLSSLKLTIVNARCSSFFFVGAESSLLSFIWHHPRVGVPWWAFFKTLEAAASEAFSTLFFLLDLLVLPAAVASSSFFPNLAALKGRSPIVKQILC